MKRLNLFAEQAMKYVLILFAVALMVIVSATLITEPDRTGMDLVVLIVASVIGYLGSIWFLVVGIFAWLEHFREAQQIAAAFDGELEEIFLLADNAYGEADMYSSERQAFEEIRDRIDRLRGRS